MNFVKKMAVVGVMGWLAVAASAPAMANEGEALLGKYDCLACHKVDMKLVGPAYKDVAAKYKGDAAAPANLLAKVKNGGAGTWGPIPMPPHPTASDDDLKKIVAWILSL
ncbi:cytochrome c [Gammaproteobacteria bacterium]